MQRSRYSYTPHKTVRIMGCATCKYSRLRFSRVEDGESKCVGAKVEDLGDCTVRVTSQCSGQSFIYPKKLIVSSSKK